MYDILEKPNIIQVGTAVEYLNGRLGGEEIMFDPYFIRDNEGNTLIYILNNSNTRSKDDRVTDMVISYEINPHLGEFEDLSMTTDHISIKPAPGKELTPAVVERIKAELAGLT